MKIPQIGVSFNLAAINGMLKTKTTTDSYFRHFKESHVSMDFEKLLLIMHRKDKKIQVRLEDIYDVIYKKEPIKRFGVPSDPNLIQHVYEILIKDSNDKYVFMIDETDDQDKFKHFLCGFVVFFEYNALNPKDEDGEGRQNKFRDEDRGRNFG